MANSSFKIKVLSLFTCITLLSACSSNNATQSTDPSPDTTPISSSVASDPGQNAPAAQEPIEIRWGNVFAPDLPFNQGTAKFKELVESRSDGRITVNLFPSSQLGNNNEIMGMLVEGTNQMGNEGGGFLAQWAPKFLVSEAVYAFRDIDHMMSVMTGEIGQEMFAELLESRGIRVIDVWYYGTRHISTNKQIDTPADLKGVKMRVPDGPLYIANGNALGASPTPISLSEVYLSLKTGVIDAQENPLPTIYQNKFQEVQKYIIMTGHNYNFNTVMVNDAFWQGLSKEDQDLIVQCVKEAGEYEKEIALQQESDLVAKLEAEGVTVHTPDVEAFRAAATKYMTENFDSEWGEGYYEGVQSYQE
ncbi:sialic acid TRAP transporter substrate-binding protein SiaP [Anaerotruncus rubiinfantis]|uniref:sialic acid TRAP transporter substrate-binding protein SiaP n=1 Tax=Anaerotruncus rubiinfantis TaxID=1720200 RepID=UPI0009AE268B|nr:sialic acid TRAP transporter substrate-binding protein SiaP [Anaerotruncus rubiinfantis]